MDKPTSSGPGFALRRQGGAIAIMTIVLLPVLLGFVALALELGRLYNRKAEMQGVADAIAVAGASKLNGTSGGISDALAAAHDVVESTDATMPYYQYGNTMVFSDAAIKFAKSPDGAAGWLDAGAAMASPAGLAYVKVDTNDLNPGYGQVDLILMPLLGNLASVSVSHTAIAGRQHLKLTPLAICAMSKDSANPITKRDNPGGNSELTEYGFRRGVSYNLMKLNPNPGAAVSYVVDPINVYPKSGGVDATTVGPYVCTGTVELPQVIGKTLTLLSGLTIGQFVDQLNSRFNSANGQCNMVAAPPDWNIKPFNFTSTNISWMSKPSDPWLTTPYPYDQVAETTTVNHRTETVADLDPSTTPIPTHYGPLWAFARAVPWSYYTGQPEPANGYTPFPATAPMWQSLYGSGASLGTYPKDKSGAQSPAYWQQVITPSTNYPGVKLRRVLNIPLLDCPAAGSPGNVVAIGRFFMTMPADAYGIYAEFAGVTLQEEVTGSVELFQ
jgi:Flp pilus assembly protein TadG